MLKRSTSKVEVPMEHGFVLPEVMCAFPDSVLTDKLDTSGFLRKALSESSVKDDLWKSVKC